MIGHAPAADAAAHAAADPDAVLAGYALTAIQRQGIERELATLRTLLGLRETAKHHLMRGYAILRRILLELDLRHRLDGGIYFLTLDELPELIAGRDFSKTIAQRRRERELLLRLAAPPVLFSDDLEAIGRPAVADGANALQGVPLSAGVAEGGALVLTEPPADLPADEGYVLVCPSTDPAWMPLFVKARALVMESGGMLSHGAIVAREFGLPAVAGLPDIHRRVRPGQRLSVDGGTGQVVLLD
jgi:pyruvate,water dikinase